MGVMFDLSTCDRRDMVFTRGALSLREAACASPAQKEARGCLNTACHKSRGKICSSTALGSREVTLDTLIGYPCLRYPSRAQTVLED